MGRHKEDRNQEQEQSPDHLPEAKLRKRGRPPKTPGGDTAHSAGGAAAHPDAAAMADASAVAGELRSLLRVILTAAAAAATGAAPAEEARAVDGLHAIQRLKLTTKVRTRSIAGFARSRNPAHHLVDQVLSA